MKKVFKIILAVALVCLISACSGSDNPIDDIIPSDGSYVDIEQIFSSSEITVYSERMNWASDDSAIAFSGAPSDAFKVASQPGSTPVQVTGWTNENWELGGYLPNFLGNGDIAYYTGWLGDDHDMHIMSASPEQELNDPEPSILRQYNGSDVGIGTDYASTPSCLSVSAAGDRVIVGYGDRLVTMDFTENPTVFNTIGDMGGYTEFMMTSDSSKICYVSMDQNVEYMNFDGSDQTEVGPGYSPTWSGDGNLLGYVSTDQEFYHVLDISSGQTTSYELPSGAYIEVSLSSDGTRIAIRTFGGAYTGIAVGDLIDS